MKCEACGVEINTDAVFCQKCGHRIAPDKDWEERSAPSETPAERWRSAMTKSATNDDDEAEEDLWTGGYSGKAMVGSWILGTIASIVLIVGGILGFPATGGISLMSRMSKGLGMI